MVMSQTGRWPTEKSLSTRRFSVDNLASVPRSLSLAQVDFVLADHPIAVFRETEASSMQISWSSSDWKCPAAVERLAA
jgi:hypothetical protein